MFVQIVDPSAYSAPYDRSLCAALARAGADVELVTSRFLYGPVPPPDGYRVTEAFYRRSARRGLDAPARRAFKLGEHFADMLRYRHRTGAADVVHYQWLTMPSVDWAFLPRPALGNGASGRAPQVFTFHERPASGRAGVARERRLLSRMDAVVVHSEHAARRVRDELGYDPARITLIPHGALDYLTSLPDEAPLPPELGRVERPVVLCFGLIRPHKGVEVALEAFRSVPDAELWVVGMPRMPLDRVRELAAAIPDRVRIVPRFIPDAEVPAYFRRADVVVLPHLNAEQSGVLHIALAFGKPMVLSAVGGFPEVAGRDGAAVIVPPGDADALAAALNELLADEGARRRLGDAATAAAAGPYAWEGIARRTLDLYGSLLG
ncbi:MAG TPA: glycosyltransferase family 4 protein [Solirubrobacterales bacterium]|nr:glycosyltransferase family 4 protein [Solirubrobacterales bacterium]